MNRVRAVEMVDVPYGHKYGFPCELPPGKNMRELLEEKNYPKDEINFALQYVRVWYKEVNERD
jgi:hypothetical protein